MATSEGEAKVHGGTNVANVVRTDGRARVRHFTPVLNSGQEMSPQIDYSGGTTMADARIVLTTVGSSEKAQHLARALVERRLAACVNIIGPIRSIYRWKDAIENEQEYLLVIKTTGERADDLEAAFAELHPYELPEHVELSIEGG